MNILTLNGGSATLKYKLFTMPTEQVLAKGVLDHPGGDGIAQAAEQAIATCRDLGVDALGHRVVHGGTKYTEPVRVTPSVLASLRTLKDLDPLHSLTETKMIETGMRQMPDIPAVAVFDTAFHVTMPEVAWRYALPIDLSNRLNLRRYGFHGISYQYVSERLLQCLGRRPTGTRLIVCHLGSGSSVCAINDGHSIDTSMGMTPLEGVMMGTRSGDIDPGLLIALLRSGEMTVHQLDELLNHRSGLFGISGGTADVRQIEQCAAAGDKYAELALEMFAYRVGKYVGAYTAALAGVDAVAFTGGIGEHSADIRSRICRRLGFLGLHLSNVANSHLVHGEPARISEDDSTVQAWVIPTNEELQIARNAQNLLSA